VELVSSSPAQVEDRAILRAVVVDAGGQPSAATFERLAAALAAAPGLAQRAPGHVEARYRWLACRLGL